jgi:hypothetical protein
MREGIVRKGLVVGIIILFFGANVVPSIGNIIEKSKSDVISNDTSIKAIYKSESNDNPPLPFDEGLVGYWSFNEGTGSIAHDTSGNGNDGTINGATWTTGVSENALSFDGVNDYMAVPNSPSLKITGSMTISAWVKTNSFSEQVITIKGSGWEYGVSWYTTIGITQSQDGKFRMVRYYNSGSNQYYRIATSNCIITDGQWHHIVGVDDGVNLRVFVDATETGSISVGGLTPYTSENNPLVTGRDGQRSVCYLNGLYDELRIYNRALSAEEIEDLYKLPPVVDFTFTPSNPQIGEKITFTSASFDPDGGSLSGFLWCVYDGRTVSIYHVNKFTHTFINGGQKVVTLSLHDDEGFTGSVAKFIDVHNFNKWALIIEPWKELGYTPIEDMLIRNGWNSDHIKILRATTGMEKYKVIEGLDWLADRVSPGDKALIWFHTHGANEWWVGAGICTGEPKWWQFLPYDELNLYLDQKIQSPITVVIDACKSGSSISYLTKQNRVILTSTTQDQDGFGNDLSYLLMQGYDDIGDYPSWGNQDDTVASEESFEFAQKHIQWSDPMCDDGYPGDFMITNIKWRNDGVDPNAYQIEMDNMNDILPGNHKEKSLAQSFKPSFDFLTRIKIFGYGNDDNINPLLISIRSSLDGVDLISPIEIYPGEFWNPSGINTGGWIEANLKNPLRVIPGETYYLVFTTINTGEYWYRWFYSDNDNYDDGKGYYSYNGQNWCEISSGLDYAFIILGRNSPSGQTVMGDSETYMPGGFSDMSINHPVSIDTSVSHADFSLTWFNASTTLNLTLEMPNGYIITPSTALINPNISYTNLSTFEFYSIDSPPPGEWELRIDGVNVPSDGEQYFAQLTAVTNLTINMHPDKQQCLKGHLINVTAEILTGNNTIINANVSVNITKPNGFNQLFLYDDGTHNDGDANDGTYSNLYNETDIEGTYIFIADARGIFNNETFTRIGDNQYIYVDFLPPKANASGPYVGKANEPIYFDGANSSDRDGSVVSWLWNFGDGTNGTGLNPIHSYLANGNYNVTLTVYDDDNLNDITSTTVTVGVPFVQFSYPQYNNIICGNVSLKWIAYNSSGSNNLLVSIYYSADFAGNWSQIANAVENTGEYSWDTTSLSEGSYILKIDAIDGQGNLGTGYSDIIDISLPPDIPSTPYGPTNGIIGVEYSFSTSTSDPEGRQVNFNFDWGDGSYSSWLGPYNSTVLCVENHTWYEADGFKVKVRARDAIGAISNWSEPLDVHIIEWPSVPPEITNVEVVPSIQSGGGYVNISTTVTDNMEVYQVNLVIQRPDTTIENFSITQNRTGDIYYCNKTYSQIGVYMYHIWANDTSGNTNISSIHSFEIINNPPYTPSNPIPEDNATEIPINDLTLWWDGGDPDIGDLVQYTVFLGNTPDPPEVGGIFFTPWDNTPLNWSLYENLMYNTKYYWKIVTLDNRNATSEGPLWSFTTQTDLTPPETTHEFSGTMGNNGWYVSDVIVTFIALDNQSGVNHTYYRIDNGDWIESTTPISIETDGTHTLEYYSIDNAGNQEPIKGPFAFKIDQTSPTITLTKQQLDLFNVKFTAEANDVTSGIDRVEFALDGVLQSNDTIAPYEWTYTGFGDHTVTATAFDQAGNSQSQSMSTPYSFTVMKYSILMQVLGSLMKKQVSSQ